MNIGQTLRDEACQRVEEANPDWSERAGTAIEELARSGVVFSANDLPGELRSTVPNPNCIGAAFLRASKRGIIRRAGLVSASTPSSHASAISTWVAAEKS